MTRPDQPVSAAASDDALFGSEADDYARYRPGLPDAAVHLLAATQHGVPDPVLLDLGTGTGQVPRALLPVLRRLVHVDLVDVNQHMLETAHAALEPVRGSRTVSAFSGGAHAFALTAPGRAPTLITSCRSFHWMSRPEVVAMVDRIAAPNAVVAIMGDGSLWTHESDWTAALRGLIQTYLGEERRAGTQGTYAGPARSYEDDLADSAFSDVTEYRFPVARAWTPENVVGYLRTTSFARPTLFADRHHEFEAETLDLLRRHAQGGALTENAVFTVLLARRPRRCRMTGGQRHTEPLDVHLIALRDGPAGPEVLLSRRAGDVYAAGCWHLVSGHLDGPWEDVVTALVRETREEAGIVVDPADVRAAVTVHHRSPAGGSRLGVFFEVKRWQGTPQVMEHRVCDAMEWFPSDNLPEPIVAYCRAGLDAYRAGARLAVHFQEPGDPIAYTLDADRTVLVPDPGNREDVPKEVRAFAEQAVGRITDWTDVSWAREESRVWRASGAEGGTWYVKIHQNDRFHQREVGAIRGWVPSLGAAAPRLVAADAQLRAVVLTAVGGRSLHGVVHPPEQQQRIFHRIGQLAAAIHTSAPPHPAAGALPLGKLERHLDGARPHLAPGDEEFIHATTKKASGLPALEAVPTHGDFQLRNLRWDEAADACYVIDFERSEEGPAIRDFVRLSDAWHGRPDLRQAVVDGYGRPFTPEEEVQLAALSVLDSVSGISYGAAHDDPELVERGLRTLSRLRAAQRP